MLLMSDRALKRSVFAVSHPVAVVAVVVWWCGDVVVVVWWCGDVAVVVW